MKKKNLLLIFVCLSGVSALIYEIVWQRYLAILLGSHARASSIVLGVFLGGMGAGYALFGKLSLKKSQRLIPLYCLVEVLLALWAICFPFFFSIFFKTTGRLYQTLGLNNLLIDLSISILLIGFPTVLMGGTLPLLTQALSKNLEDSSRMHSKLYGFNTLGACLGCLLAGYVLIPHTSFEKALGVGGFLNLITAGFFFAKVKQKLPDSIESPYRLKPLLTAQKMILGVGFISGFCVLTLETILIRLVGLSIGSSNFNFTLVIGIFIFSLSLGSLLMKKISKASITTLFWNQIATAGLLLGLYLSISYWSYGAHVIRASLKDVPQAFFFFQLLLAGALSLVLVLPIGFSGFTLPLCFHLLKDQENTLGGRVGQLYFWNTVGSVLGALGGGYALLNFFNSDQIFQICIFGVQISALFALYLSYREKKKTRVPLLPGSLVFAISLAVLFLPGFALDRWIQPFRNQEQLDSTLNGARSFGEYLSRTTKLEYWKDGPNTTIGVGITPKEGPEESRTLYVNGKSDGNTRGDFFTTLMLAHLPALLTGKIEKTCVVGFGTGITAGTLSLYSEVKKIDILEISNTIIENAYRFDAYNGGVSKNPKVKFHELDAFRFFEGGKEPYDLIISEPSNPWVIGIENLYSQEFYRLAKNSLSREGSFTQWIHTYSFNDGLFRMVLRTMRQEFPYVSVFQLKGGDFALMGRLEPFGSEAFDSLLRKMNQTPIKTTLQTAGVTLPEVVLALEVIPPNIVDVIARGGEIHHLTSPRLSNEAARAFFLRTSATPHLLKRNYKQWPEETQHSLLRQFLANRALSPTALAALRFSFCDNEVSRNPALCEESVFASLLDDTKFHRNNLYGEVLPGRVVASVQKGMEEKKKTFTPQESNEVYSFFESYKKYLSPIAYVNPYNLLSRVEVCLKNTPQTRELYGECLLQKLLIIDGLGVKELDFDLLAKHYLTWLGAFPKSDPQYQKLKEAGDILVRMIRKKDT